MTECLDVELSLKVPDKGLCIEHIAGELGEGGNIKQALKNESWGATFGWLEDKFSINWMVNIAKE